MRKSKSTLKTISLLMVCLVCLFGKAYGVEPAVSKLPISSNKQISNVIADRFVEAMQRRNYTFLTEDKLESLRKEICEFAAKYQPIKLSLSDQEVLLCAIDQYVRDYFLNRGLDYPGDFLPNYDMEGAYLKFGDCVNTFKWKLWLALIRKPLTAEQLKKRQIQHDWLREFIAGVAIRPADWGPKGVAPRGIRRWALTHIEDQFANPLSLLCEPMTEKQFEVFKQLMKRSAVNGLSYTVTSIPVRVLGARAHGHADVERAYSYPFDIELPFEDKVRSIWGGGDGAGPHLAFASNAQFRGFDVFLGSHSVFDIVSGLWRVEPTVRDASLNTLITQWVREQDKGDIAYNDNSASLIVLRGAKMAELNVSNWFEADRLSNADLRKLIEGKGQTVISVKRLPPMNGPRQVGVNEPRFFIVVQNRDGRLAVMDLRSREFGQINLVSRLRGAVLAYLNAHPLPSEDEQPIPRAVDPVVLLKQGRRVQVPQNCRSFAQFLEKLAFQADTVATQSFMGRYGQRKRPPRIGIESGPAFEVLAAALDGTDISIEITQNGYWAFFEPGDKNKKHHYSASGGLFCKLEGFNRKADQPYIWALGRVLFEPAIRKNIASIQSTFTVAEAIDNRGKNVPIPKAETRWDSSTQIEIFLGKQQPPAKSIKKLRVKTAVAVATKWATFKIDRLDHSEPIVVEKDGVRIQLKPIQEIKWGRKQCWQIPIDIQRENITLDAKGMVLKDEVYFITNDGKKQQIGSTGTYLSGSHAKIAPRCDVDAFDPATTSLSITEPAAIEIVPFELTFHNIPIIQR